MVLKKTPFFIVFFLIVLIETVVADAFNFPYLHYISKPAIVISLGFYFITNSSHLKKTYKVITLLALFFSLLGDVLLMFVLKSELFFISGLLSFLMAHVFYSLLFYKKRNTNLKFLPVLILLIVYAFGLFILIKNDIKPLLIPIVLYMLVLLTMVLFAYRRKLIVNKQSYNLVLLGAVLFMMSDSLLAINKFYHTIPFETFCIMLTYALAQLCIVLGITKQKN